LINFGISVYIIQHSL